MKKSLAIPMVYLDLLPLVPALYCLWRLLNGVHFYFREYYMLWNIAFGRIKAVGKCNSNLHMYMTETDDLDEVSVKEFYGFYKEMCDSTFTISEFRTYLQSFKHAVICRERKDGSLRGTLVIGLDKKEENGYKYTLLRLGLAMFRKDYTGGPLLYYAIAYHILKELLLHPFTPLYIIGKSVTYKSYLVMCRNIRNSYPRYDNKETPAFVKKVINDFAMTTKPPSAIYNPETFVIKQEIERIKPGVVEFSKKELNDPHIKFFVERVPGWVKGHRMVTMGQICWQDLMQMMWKRVVGKPRGIKSSSLPATIKNP